MTLTDLEYVRQRIGDYYDSNPVVDEDISDQIVPGGINRIFRVRQYRSLLGKSVWNVSRSSGFTPPFLIIADGAVVNNATKLDSSQTILSFGQFAYLSSQKPPQTSIIVSYFFQFFTDADIQAFLDKASTMLGDTQPNPLDSGVPQLISAVQLFAASLALKALASKAAQVAERQTLGQATVDMTQKAKLWGDEAEKAWKEAISFRDDYYERSGRKKAPAFAFGQMNNSATVWTPRG